MKNGFKKALIVGAVIFGIVLGAHYWGLGKYLTLSALKENRVYFENIVHTNYLKAVIFYILIYATIISAAIPGVPPLTIIGGFLFGFIPAGMYAIVGAVTGAAISFLTIRYILSGLIRGKYANKLEVFNEKIGSYGVAGYLLTMQLMGVIPYFVINTLAALTDVPFITFLWTTLIGSLPIIFIYAFAGQKLYSVESVRDIFSPSIIMLLLFLVIVSLMPTFLRFSRRVTDLD